VRWIKNWMHPRARMGRQFRRGFREGLAKLWEVADREARSAVGRVTTRWRVMAADQFDTDGAMAVGFRYRPHGYPGPLTVFWTEPGAEAAEGPELGWSQPHRGPIECVRLPGDHLSMLQQPQVAEAAAALAERLHRAQGAADPDTAREPAAHLVAS
jgi:thioesterase domain-containing protein